MKARISLLFVLVASLLLVGHAPSLGDVRVSDEAGSRDTSHDQVRPFLSGSETHACGDARTWHNYTTDPCLGL